LSRNKDRTGAGSPALQTDAPIGNVANTPDQPFSFVVPTEFVELPSRGKFYSPGHPLHNQTTIEIKQMTAKEEDILTSRSLLKQGVAIDRVIQSIIMDKRVDVASLLIGDKNALVIASRVSGYGNEYNTAVTCPTCETKQEYSFDLNLAEITHGSSNTNVSDNGDGTFSINLPTSGLNVCFKLLNGHDEKRISNTNTKGRVDNIITRQLRTMIVSVNENSESDALNYVAQNLPSKDSAYLRKAYKDAAPNINIDQHFSCENCEFDQVMEVPLTADFFWPDS
jgi:hypothetical protein